MSGFIIVWFVYAVVIIALLGLSIYGFILFVKLAHRGIKALDIYIDEKTNRNNNQY